MRTRAYPTAERNGVIWTYMGPREAPPPLPGPRAQHHAAGRPRCTKFLRECNWLQAFEGDIDTTHIGFLHFGSGRAPKTFEPRSMDYYTAEEPRPAR